jgi:hypothetical protein
VKLTVTPSVGVNKNVISTHVNTANNLTLFCGRSPAESVGSNPTGGHVCLSVVSVVCCQVRGLCDELITLPEESYRL